MKSPSSYAPTVSRTRATSRRNLVLAAMVDAGFIDARTRDAARAEALVVRDGLNADEPYGLYFKEHVRRELVDQFGWQRVYQGGLRVYSTIDVTMQKAAEAAIAEGLKTIDARRKTPDPEPLQAALVAMDPATGHIRAMVGGRDFAKSSFNRAVQARRQPGSAFKPFVYAAALEAGYTPATMIENLDVPIDTLEGAWTPEDEHSTATALSLRAALRTSSNRAAVRLLQDVGIPKTVNYARTMGVGDVPSVPSLALGSGEVTLQSMTAAYAAFANQGQVPKPITIRRVEDRDGRVLFAAEESSTSAITPTTAFLMTTMLADVINAGTGARARSVGFKLPAAGKTGTTNDFKDAWFIGFTPSLIAGVWVGFDQPHTILRNGFAGDIAVPMWASFMKTATRGRQAAVLQSAARRDDRQRLPALGQARERRLRGRRGRRRPRRSDPTLDGLHGVLREGHGSGPGLRSPLAAQLPRFNLPRRERGGCSRPHRGHRTAARRTCRGVHHWSGLGRRSRERDP